MDHFVIKKRHILHLFNDHKEMFAGDIVTEVLSWIAISSEITPLKREIKKWLCSII